MVAAGVRADKAVRAEADGIAALRFTFVALDLLPNDPGFAIAPLSATYTPRDIDYSCPVAARRR